MFTTEIRINGTLVAHVYGHNEGVCEELPTRTKYRYEYYAPESGKIINGEVLHKRDEGISRLVASILLDATKD